MAVLLALALVGAAMRHWGDDPSLVRDIGTLLMVLWLPAVGNLVAFLIRRLPRRARPSSAFANDAPFTAHLTAQVTPLVQAVPQLDPGARVCTILLGSEGFTARSELPLAQWLASAGGQSVSFELLRPALGSGRLTPGIDFYVVVGAAAVARGRVTASSFTALPAVAQPG